MILNTKLHVHGKTLATFQMYKDTRVKNQFTAKRWVQSLSITEGDNVAVSIADETHILATITLVNNERGGYHGAIDTGDLYAWANLTSGYGSTWGMTACIMFRRKPRVQNMSLQDCSDLLTYDMGPGR